MTDVDEIRNTLARFCQCLDGRRFEEFSQTFTAEASFNDRVGRATILPWTIRVGRYTDELARQPTGGWLFARRHLEFVPV